MENDRRGQVALLWPSGRKPDVDDGVVARLYENVYRPQLATDLDRLHDVFLRALLPNGPGFDEYLNGTHAFKQEIGQLALTQNDIRLADASFVKLHENYTKGIIVIFNRAARLVARDFEPRALPADAPDYTRALIASACYDTDTALTSLAHKMASAEGMAEMYVARVRDGQAGEAPVRSRWIDARHHTDMLYLRNRILDVNARVEQQRRGRLAARTARPQSDADETRARGNIRVVARSETPSPPCQPA